LRCYDGSDVRTFIRLGRVTPLQLLGLVVVFAVLRVAISLVQRHAIAGGSAVSGTSTLTVIREYLDAFIVAGLVALFLIAFIVRTFFIPSGSMEPTLQVNDVLLVNEFEYRFRQPQEGDIVVFTPPLDQPNDFIKRAIGVPGDDIRVHQGACTATASL
jgi:hypothetical protein